MEYYIYVYLDTRKPGKYKYGEYEFEYEPFYIGRGRSERYYQHVRHSYGDKKQSLKVRIIRAIRKETGKNPIILKIKDNITYDFSLIQENYFIKLIGRRDLEKGPLVNWTNGGEGSKELSHIIRKRIGQKVSENHNNPNSKFQKIMKSKKFSETMKKAMTGEGNHMYGKKGKDNPNYGRGKNVYQYKLNGELVREWPNSNIVKNELGIDRVGVERRCKRNSHKHYKGFIWSYKNKPDETFIKFRSIKLIDGVYNVLLYNGEMLSYTCIRSLSKDLNINRKLLRSYVKRKIKK